MPAPPAITLQSPANGAFLATATPRITLSWSDDLSGVNPATASFVLDGQDRTAGASVSATGLSFQPPQPLADGVHSIVVRVSDHSGKEAHAEFSFTTDTVAPVLRLASPGPLVEGDTTPAVVVDFSDATSGIDPATLDVKVDGTSIRGSCTVSSGSATCEPPELAEGQHSITAEIADRAGNRATAASSFEIVLDQQQPPVLRIVSPAAGLITGDATPEIVLEYSHPGGVDLATLSVVLDGQDLTAGCDVQPERATCEPPPLAAGPHTLKAAIENQRGLRTERERFFEISLQLSVVIESPVQGELTQVSTLEVSGTVSPEAGSVSVDDIEGTIQNGVFVIADVPLHEGSNTLTVVARSAGGGIGTATVTVVRDTDAPRVVIAAPPGGAGDDLAADRRHRRIRRSPVEQRRRGPAGGEGQRLRGEDGAADVLLRRPAPAARRERHPRDRDGHGRQRGLGRGGGDARAGCGAAHRDAPGRRPVGPGRTAAGRPFDGPAPRRHRQPAAGAGACCSR